MPVIFLTSKDEEVDELMGLRLGADDYIPKPFDLRELLARVRAVRMALNQTMCADSAALSEGCEVAFFPPVTGG